MIILDAWATITCWYGSGWERSLKKRISIILLGVILLLTACSSATPAPEETVILGREQRIPADAFKILPQDDPAPPVTLSSEYEQPVPVTGLVNTAGGEDSPFIMPDGKTLYFWFTPDVNIPPEMQIMDGVTGIYVARQVAGAWEEPLRVMLQDPGKLAGDGCEFILGDRMWFCSAREGYTGMHWFTAEMQNGAWQNWQVAEFDLAYQVGELHISKDGTELYFASNRQGGQGAGDLWVSRQLDGVWQHPVDLTVLNTPEAEGWPALNPAGDELWFSRDFGVWRSKRVNGEWQPAELIISPLAGEPSIDASGNIYFTHHFFENGQMLEADIYVAYKK
jgi:hypothetical protein